MEPRGTTLVARYRASFGLPPEVEITKEMILKHWELEKGLRTDLLDTNAEDRWQTFERCYDTLYRELPWLTSLETGSEFDAASHHRLWKEVIGSPPMTVYEIGSGRGSLIRYLAESGFECKATEITRERGKKWTPGSSNLIWGTSDGVHLDKFEPIEHYDVVISDQVVEHLHPDDVPAHFEGVRAILRARGRYVFATPHASFGPSDVSRVFDAPTPMGMHLKEYTYGEFVPMLQRTGFTTVEAVFRLPAKLRSRAGRLSVVKPATGYLRYLRDIEQLGIIERIESWRPEFHGLTRLLLFPTDIMIVATKPSGGVRSG